MLLLMHLQTFQSCMILDQVRHWSNLNTCITTCLLLIHRHALDAPFEISPLQYPGVFAVNRDFLMYLESTGSFADLLQIVVDLVYRDSDPRIGCTALEVLLYVDNIERLDVSRIPESELAYPQNHYFGMFLISSWLIRSCICSPENKSYNVCILCFY
jgi:hypothetical protein